MELAARYQPQEKESKWYKHWESKQYFKSVPDEREPFSIVIPPPNVTGVLHMGHMLNITIQDVFMRHARQNGKNACWVPGTDHASIATEAKVVKLLREQGIKKTDIGREAFLKHAFDWKDKYGGIILEQLKKLGASCDWDRTKFTMDESLSKAVVKVFVDLHKKGKIYRGLRMTNWDPVALTALSNEEVIHREANSNLFHVQYRIEGTEDQYLVIATTRPETIMADAAIAVHPDDDRYKDLVGKKVLIPIINRAIPIIADSYVDTEFGTGALKITPAHDQNDHEVGERHNLEVIDILNADATLNEKAQILIGQDRFEARKNIKILLKEAEALVEIEQYRTSVGYSERTDAVVEPRLTYQWFLDMKDFSATALKAVEDGEVKFYPDHMRNMYHNWLNEDNVRDWCISRQLWWGQQIPAWFYKDEIFVAETEAEALEQAQEKFGSEITGDDLKRDEDVVDTWFSSWLWPISVFDGFENQDELNYYYPTNVLVTGWDIMFFWVARMIMAGYEWAPDLLADSKKGVQPFNEVYFTGMVRDAQRRKMSKSLGNSPDALALIERYGADGVRFGMLSSGAAGNDIIFDAPIDKETKQVLNESKLCDQGLNFGNKMWNALRLLKGWEVVAEPITEDVAAINELAGKWFENKLSKVLGEIERHLTQYRLSDALMEMYKFIWGDFCSEYLEMIKPEYGKPIDQPTLDRSIDFFSTLVTAMHPFMPFVTEEIWHNLKERKEGEDCCVAPYPKARDFNKDLIASVDSAISLVSKIRKTRNEKGLKQKEPLQLLVQKSQGAEAIMDLVGLKHIISKMAFVEELTFLDGDAPQNGIPIVIGQEKFFLLINQTINVEEEKVRLEEDLKYQRGFLKGVEKKLSNERFVQNAPPKVIEIERKKLADGLAKIQHIEESLANLN